MSLLYWSDFWGSLHDLNEVFKILNLDLNSGDKAKYAQTKEYLDNFGVKIAELSESEAINLVSTMVGLGIKKGKELCPSGKPV